jgi:hypothetical protein
MMTPVYQPLAARKSSLGDDDMDYERQHSDTVALVIDRVDSDLCSSEDNDTMDDQQLPFRQIDYLWLFNPQMEFSKRAGFVLDDACLSLEDYSRMRFLNRYILSVFLTQIQNSDLQTACSKFSLIEVT